RLVTGQARFTLTIPGLELPTAQILSDAIDNDFQIDVRALAINETGDARWNVVAYFDSQAAAQKARVALAQEAAIIDIVPEMDWVRQSLAGLPPVKAGRFFLYGSHDRERKKPGGISLEIDAGTAFGTGHHGTTEGCLLALDHLIKRRRPKRILDIGCGTGVLAIAAAKAARVTVLATDIDPEAVRVTRHNALINSVGPAIIALRAAGLNHRDIHGRAPFDLIFANILARPLASLAYSLSKILARGGSLILSGLTLDQGRWINAAYRNSGLIRLASIKRGSWVTLIMTRPKGTSEAGSRGRQDRCGSRSRRRRPAPWRG
ncbi:MAG TPA: 50S ribosomal protein L11 methyltransferase, partial [Aestuariivirga sp.]|nr:50S ribosomal protein L11 methyltransferase [Aestuariivirga sp.]